MINISLSYFHLFFMIFLFSNYLIFVGLMNFGVVIKGKILLYCLLYCFIFFTVLICKERHESIPSEKKCHCDLSSKIVKM